MSDKSRHLVTQVQIPNTRHIVGREDSITIGRGDEARKVAIQKKEEIPDASDQSVSAPQLSVAEDSSKSQSSNIESKTSGQSETHQDVQKPDQKLASSIDATENKDGKTDQKQKTKIKQKQKVGCFLSLVIVAIFAVITLIILIQGSRGPRNSIGLVNPANIETGEENSDMETPPAGNEISSSEIGQESGQLTNLSGGDAETGMKLIFGIISFLSFLVTIFSSFLFFTAKTPDNKKRARQILIPAVVFLVLSAVINFVIVAYYNQKNNVLEQEAYTDSAINIKYYSSFRTSAPLDIEFDVSDLPEIQNVRFISWNFGDGSTGSGVKVRHIFERIGDFEVTATFTLNKGQERSYVRHIPINNILPQVDLRASTLIGLAPLTVSFDASGSRDQNGNIIEYQWFFPNGVNKTGLLTDYVFEQKGEYEVTLRVTDNNSESTEKTVKITVTDEGVPEAIITTDPNPAEGQLPLLVRFAGGNSRDQNGNIVRYEWDFGDGSARENGQNAIHSFGKEGTYIVKLTVWDNDGISNIAQSEVKVLKRAIKPIATIFLEKGKFAGVAPLEVTFDGGQSFDTDGSIVSYQWDFGDGSSSETGQKVTHIYTDTGQYELSLTVTDDDGLSATRKQTIKAQAPEPTPPVVVLISDPDPAIISVGDEIKFNASQSYDLDGNIISYEWDFGDRASRLGPAEITHRYSKVGIYTVTLTAYDNSGKTARGEVRVAVSEPNLVAKITADKTSGTVPSVVQFQATGAGTVDSYEWDFGDGLTSSRRAPLHIFTEVGEYTVRLKVTDTTGVVSEDLILIQVKERE